MSPSDRAPRRPHGRGPDTRRLRSGLFVGTSRHASRQEAPSASAGNPPATPTRSPPPTRSQPGYPSLALRAFCSVRKPQARARGIRPPLRHVPRHQHGRGPDTRRLRSGLFVGTSRHASRQEAPSASAGNPPATPTRSPPPTRSRPGYPSLALRAFCSVMKPQSYELSRTAPLAIPLPEIPNGAETETCLHPTEPLQTTTQTTTPAPAGASG